MTPRNILLSLAQQPNAGQGRLTAEVPRSHTMTSVNEWSVHGTDLYRTTHNTHNRQDIHASRGIRTRNPRNPRLKPLDHWDWQKYLSLIQIKQMTIIKALLLGNFNVCSNIVTRLHVSQPCRRSCRPITAQTANFLVS